MDKIFVGLLLIASPFEATAQTQAMDDFRLEAIPNQNKPQLDFSSNAKVQLNLADPLNEVSRRQSFSSLDHTYKERNYCGSAKHWATVTPLHDCVVRSKRSRGVVTWLYIF